MRRTGLFGVLAALVLAPALIAAPAATRGVVLGARVSFGQFGRGWGTVHPVAVDDNGDPSGKAWRLRWSGWGRGTSSASGLTYLEPAASRGWRKGRVQLRASRIGRCAPSGPRAYTRLEVRVAELHGGRFGAWRLWNGRPNLCHS